MVDSTTPHHGDGTDRRRIATRTLENAGAFPSDACGARHPPGTAPTARPSWNQPSRLRRMAKDRIPTSRLARTAKVSSLAAGQAARHLGTRATNLARTEDGRDKALERRHL